MKWYKRFKGKFEPIFKDDKQVSTQDLYFREKEKEEVYMPTNKERIAYKDWCASVKGKKSIV